MAAGSTGWLRYMRYGLGKGRGDVKKRDPVVDYAMVVAGTFLIGFAIKNTHDSVSMVTGGVSGVVIVAKELWFVPLWLTNTVLNIPSLTAGFFFYDWRFIKHTLFTMAVPSAPLYVLSEVPHLGSNLLLSALFGGIINDVGTNLVSPTSCIIGGTDLLTALVQRRLEHYTLVQIMQILDGLIVVADASMFGVRTAPYALIIIFCVVKVTDGLIGRLKSSEQACIISEHYRKIAEAIMGQTRREMTNIRARGIYSDQERRMLFCVVLKREIVRLKEIVAEFDSNASVIVNDVRGVFGEGFIKC